MCLEWKEDEGRDCFSIVWLEEMEGRENKLNPLGSPFSIRPYQAEMERKVLEITILPISLLLTCPLHKGIKVKKHIFLLLQTK